MHYGPPPEPSQPPSGLSTPASEQKRFSDPPTSWDSRGSWAPGGWASEGLMKGEQLAPINFGDRPPWSEDEDLQSPVVVSSRHRKHKSSSGGFSGQSRGRGRRRDDGERTASMLSQENYEQDRGYFVGTGGDGSERYYVNNEEDEADGPGGGFVTYSPEQARHSTLALYNVLGQRESHFAGTLPSRSYTDETGQDYRSESDASSSASSPGLILRHDESRYSRDYQFTIASPDEEMHGKAVALFDFERENENELPLVEGQVIWVSYRHGQGWLVAEDPRTRESGLVPEEYVRLLRDIQGGLNSLTGQANNQLLSPLAPRPESDRANTTPGLVDLPKTNSMNDRTCNPLGTIVSFGNQKSASTKENVHTTLPRDLVFRTLGTPHHKMKTWPTNKPQAFGWDPDLNAARKPCFHVDKVREVFKELRISQGRPISNTVWISYWVQWDLPVYLAELFDPQQKLSEVLTITAGISDEFTTAIATSVGDYMKKTWGKTGTLLLVTVETWLSNKRKGTLKTVLCHSFQC
jgi:hypothetical protein